VKRGVPDLFLPVARGGFHGLWIELKAGKNPVNAAQKEWHAALVLQGYAVHVVRDEWTEAKRLLENYLSQKP
jgi:hypothetical protein